MALLKEDDNFTHIIAIDFGTGASGYISIFNLKITFKNIYIFEYKLKTYIINTVYTYNIYFGSILNFNLIINRYGIAPKYLD